MTARNDAISLAAWPPEHVAELTRLYCSDGLPCAEIGRRMGISKNTVIGKVRQLELERDAAFVPSAAQICGMNSRVQSTTLTSRLAALDVFPAAGSCVFPIGHPRKGGRFCGEAVAAEGKPYCSTHAAVCWVRESKTREHAAEPMFVARSARR